MKFVADLHLHSCYSRATSKEANPENFYRWAIYKGVTLVGTGDFTHPAWREELKEKLEPAEEGLYRLKEEYRRLVDGVHTTGSEATGFSAGLDSFGEPLVRFMISGEISTIYKKGGRVRKVHHLILLPSLEAADELSRRLEEIGNIRSDGRPILGIDSRQLLEMTLDVCPEALFIPAHIWTPHFSLFGAKSGFDAIEECFEDLTDHIYAVETGLSSDPPMNWRLSALDRFALVSNSDAHSPRNLAREANLFNTELSYYAIYQALKERDGTRFLGTLEFFPEEGKYHYDGHRGCNLRWKPSQTRAAGGVCPVCGRKVTVGVLHRVEELADREDNVRPPAARHFESLIPLPEVIASALGVGASTKQVTQRYFSLIRNLGPELVVLRETPLEKVLRVGGPLIAEAVRRMRTGEIEILPGYDGEYGKIILMRPEERQDLFQQATLFTHTVRETASSAVPAKEETSVPPVAEQKISGELPVYESNSGQSAQEKGILAGLNPQQQEAVTAKTGPVIVIAGPGTGKTRTLVHRIAWLIGDQGIAPHQITAVTFTNKAAMEIRQRVAKLLNKVEGIEELTVGTFHSICLDILRSCRRQSPTNHRDFSELLELTVLDEADSREVLEEVLREKGRRGHQEGLKVLKRISFLKSRGILPSSPEVPADLNPIYTAYQERLGEYRALDYDDILLQTVNLFERLEKENVPELQHIRSRFTHLLVDEFQDVNPVQYKLVRLWAGKGKNLFVIGDPNQAIYGFRGADYRFFKKLKDDFPGAQIFKLTLNYRSTPTIIRAASAVVAKNSENNFISGLESTIVATKTKGPKIIHLQVPSEMAEGIAIVKEIGRMVGGTTMLQAHDQPSGASERTWSFSDIAVLFRTGRQSETLEECFLKEGIPYRIVGRESFLEEQPVRETLAFFRCVIQPEDDFHLYRCLGRGRFDLGREGIALVRETARKMNCSAWKAITELTEGGRASGTALTDRLLAFRNALEKYRSLIKTELPSKILAHWIEENNLGQIQAMDRLLQVASRFSDLPAFLHRIVLAQEADYERMGNNKASVETVSLMTLHAAKGLEFPVVFIAGVEDGLIPLTERKTSTAKEDTLAEERRLFYVGLTRAKDMLILLSARNRARFGSKASSCCSPFVREIPPDCLEQKSWVEQVNQKNVNSNPKFKQLSLF
ncbi:UvrD-helicase domain-containing protein [Calderihabitans maritimus]|uniref:DNA 3'-5' helicase n=1 Tax=Calderihabitans maritimus TaxID=1246530 RepID=A0A1Z5HV82_9FIRM|nr:UvrD-helicase domain-containing protein [Calderihabitans maritimus]GAW93200.1 UvrD/REP helicase [Calderihabitans maritimus]